MVVAWRGQGSQRKEREEREAGKDREVFSKNERKREREHGNWREKRKGLVPEVEEECGVWIELLRRVKKLHGLVCPSILVLPVQGKERTNDRVVP